MQIKRCASENYSEWDNLCYQPHGNWVACVIRCAWEWKWVRQCVRERVRVSACVSTQQGGSHEKFLLEAVVCFSSVKSYMGNIGNIFRQTPWLMMVIFGGHTILTGKHCLSCKRVYAKQSIIYTQVCICSFYSPGSIIFCFFSRL